MSALKLLQLLMKPGKAAAKEEGAQVGRLLREKAEQGDYFAKAKTPATNAQEVKDKYGVIISPLDEEEFDGPPAYSARLVGSIPYEFNGDLYYQNHFTDAFYKSKDILKRKRGPQAQLIDYINEAGLDPHAQWYGIDALASVSGEGMGSRTYPALYDIVSGVNGLYNYPFSGLTTINVPRRSLNMADSILRDPKLDMRLVPEPSQLMHGLTIPEYMKLSTDEKVGSLIMGAARDALPHVSDYMYGMKNPDEIDEFIRAFKEAGQPLHEKGIGNRSLRKFSILENILNGSEGEIHPDMFKGLGMRKGGLAQMRGA